MSPRLGAALLFGALLRSGAEETPAEAGRPPDVLLVVLDDVDRLNAEVVDTPNLDLLAAEGVSYLRAYSMPACQQTRYGLYFQRYRITIADDVCAPAATPRTPWHGEYSIAKLFQGAGYRTGLFGKWHVGTNRKAPRSTESVASWQVTPQLHGFDTWRAGVAENVGQCGGSDYFDWTRVDDGDATSSTEYQTTAVRDALLAWWTSRPGPRFAVLSFQAPHVPLHRPPDDLVPEKYREATTPREMYEAMLASCDTVLGQVLDALREEPGGLDDTWVVVLGDNGVAKTSPHPSQRPNKVKGSVFEGGVNVPLVIRGPGIAGPHETSALVHVVDLMPTLAEIIGRPIPDWVEHDGVSLVPTLASPEATVRDHVFVGIAKDIAVDGGSSRQHIERAIITSRYKLRTVRDTLLGTSSEELYDLEADPREAKARGASSKVARGLRRLLAEYP